MIHKIAFAGCLHKRPKDFTTIKGYVQCCDKVQESLLEFIKDKGITRFVSTGDWYDRGYIDDVTSAIADITYEEHLHSILNGHFYGVIGNHIHIQLDSNPEVTLIQPHTSLHNRKKIRRDYQIMNTPATIVIDDIQISLVHFQAGAKSPLDYCIKKVSPSIKYHIAVTHDDVFIPSSKMNILGLPVRGLDSQIGETFKDVDLVISGHIHNPMGMFDLTPKTRMFIPGSLTNTNAGLRSRHTSIKIPVLTIDDEKHTHTLEFFDFDLHTEMLTFYDVKKEKKDNLKSIRGNNIETMYEDSDIATISSDLASLTFSGFIREQGYTEMDKELIRLVLKDPTNVVDIINRYIRGDDIGNTEV